MIQACAGFLPAGRLDEILQDRRAFLHVGKNLPGRTASQINIIKRGEVERGQGWGSRKFRTCSVSFCSASEARSFATASDMLLSGEAASWGNHVRRLHTFHLPSLLCVSQTLLKQRRWWGCCAMSIKCPNRQPRDGTQSAWHGPRFWFRLESHGITREW